MQIAITVRTTRRWAHDAVLLSAAGPVSGLSDQKLENHLKVRLDVMRLAERDILAARKRTPKGAMTAIAKTLLNAADNIQLTVNPIQLIA